MSKEDHPTANVGDPKKPCSMCDTPTSFKTSGGTYYCPEHSPTEHIAVTGFPTFEEWKRRHG